MDEQWYWMKDEKELYIPVMIIAKYITDDIAKLTVEDRNGNAYTLNIKMDKSSTNLITTMSKYFITTIR